MNCPIINPEIAAVAVVPAALTLQYRDRPDLWDQKGLVVNRVQEASRVLWDLAVLREIPDVPDL